MHHESINKQPDGHSARDCLLTLLQSFSLPSSTSSFTLSILSSCSSSSTLCVSAASFACCSWSFCGGHRPAHGVQCEFLQFRHPEPARVSSVRCGGAAVHLGVTLHGLPLLGPACPPLSQGQAAVGQLQGELGRLQASLVQLRVNLIPLGDHGAHVALQSVHGTLAVAQALPQAAHLLQGRLTLRLAIKKKEKEKNMSAIYSKNNFFTTSADVLKIRNEVLFQRSHLVNFSRSHNKLSKNSVYCCFQPAEKNDFFFYLSDFTLFHLLAQTALLNLPHI